MTGINSAQKALAVTRSRSFIGAGATDGSVMPQICRCHALTRPTRGIKPGRMPETNKAGIEVLRGWPFLRIIGCAMVAKAAASPRAESRNWKAGGANCLLRTPRADIGTSAAQMLLALMSGKTVAQPQIDLGYELVVRGST